MSEVEYPPKSKYNCAICSKVLPTIPFTGIGWRDVALNPPSKERTRICNICFVEWRKTHPPSKRELNVNLINRIITLLYIVYALYGLISFMSYGIGNWSGFLVGPGMLLIIAFIFTNLVYGLVNKKIDFVPPPKSDKKSKWEFKVPEKPGAKYSFQPKHDFQPKSEVPTSLHYSRCDVCGLEKTEDDLFTHPAGYRICLNCIKGKKDESQSV